MACARNCSFLRSCLRHVCHFRMFKAFVPLALLCSNRLTSFKYVRKICKWWCIDSISIAPRRNSKYICEWLPHSIRFLCGVNIHIHSSRAKLSYSLYRNSLAVLTLGFTNQVKRAQTIQLYASGNAPKENNIRTVTLPAQSKSKTGTWEFQICSLL